MGATVGRKGKKIARAVDSDMSTRVPEENLTRLDKLPTQFMLAKSFKEAGIQNVIQIKNINAYKVSIRFTNDESTEKLLCTKSFNENGFKCKKSLDISQSYGVIKVIDLGFTEKEIIDRLRSETLIVEVNRLKLKNSVDGKREQSESIRAYFKGIVLGTDIH